MDETTVVMVPDPLYEEAVFNWTMAYGRDPVTDDDWDEIQVRYVEYRSLQ